MTDKTDIRDIELGYRTVEVDNKSHRIPKGIIRIPGGWQVALKRQGKLLFNMSVKDDGQPAAQSLQRAEAVLKENIERLPLTKNEIERPRAKSSIDTHMRGVMISWVRSRRRPSRPYRWGSLLVVVSIRLEPGQRCTNKSVHAGTQNTLTQESLNAALKKAYAIREHHNRIERGDIPCVWPSVDELVKTYNNMAFPQVDVEAVKKLIAAQ